MIGNKVIGLAIHDYSIEMVEVSISGQKGSLESFNRMPLPAEVMSNGEIQDEEMLKTIIKDLLKQANPKAVLTKNTAIIFPPSKVLTHIFTFPASLSQEEVRKAIPYEAESLIPFSFNDIYWDVYFLEKESNKVKNPVQRVFFACIIKTIAEKYADLLESIGLIPAVFGINTAALKYALLKQAEQESTCMIIDFGTLSVDYQIMKKEVVRHYFSSNESGHRLAAGIAREAKISEKEIFEKKESETLDLLSKNSGIIDFIKKSYKRGEKIIQEYEKQFKEPVETIILSGDFLNLPNLLDLAENHFKEKKIIIADPRTTLLIDESRFTRWGPAEKGGAIYAVYFTQAIGIAMKSLLTKNTSINLLPDRLKSSMQERRRFLMFVIASFLMSVLSVFAAIYLLLTHFELQFERRELEIKKSAIQTIIYGSRYNQIYSQIQSFNQEVDELSRIDKSLFSVPDTITKIYSYFPPGITINSWDYNDNDLGLVFTGLAKDRETMLELRKNLEKCEFIQNIEEPNSNYDKKNDISFSIKFTLIYNKLACYGTAPEQPEANL